MHFVVWQVTTDPGCLLPIIWRARIHGKIVFMGSFPVIRIDLWINSLEEGAAAAPQVNPSGALCQLGNIGSSAQPYSRLVCSSGRTEIEMLLLP